MLSGQNGAATGSVWGSCGSAQGGIGTCVPMDQCVLSIWGDRVLASVRGKGVGLVHGQRASGNENKTKVELGAVVQKKGHLSHQQKLFLTN